MDTNKVKRFDELNVSQLSLISVQERIPEDFREWLVEVEDGKRRYRVTCQALPEYGVPHGIDNDVSVALVNLYIEQGLPEDGTLTASPYLILQMAGLGTSGRYYLALERSLKRLLTTNYFISEGWRDHPRRRWTTASFRYIDKLEYSSVEGSTLDQASILKITLPADLIRSVRSGYLKALDLAFMHSLKRPPTRALYRLLDARRYDPEQPELRLGTFEISLMEWADACKIVADRATLVERALSSAHEELLERGYLRDVTISGRGKNKTVAYTFGEIASPVDPVLLSRMAEVGLAKNRALSLAQSHGEDAVELALRRLTGLLASGFKPRSRAALLVDLLKNPAKYVVPGGLPWTEEPGGSPAAPAPKAKSSRAKAPKPSPDEDLQQVLLALPREAQVEEAMRVLVVMLRGDLRLPEFDALRALLDASTEPLDVKTRVLSAIAKQKRAEVLAELRSELAPYLLGA
jgi:plasmid replication initiation protein